MDEAARISALNRYQILDTVPEERFDRITKIVQIVLDVPITAISLVDEKRQWFKSKLGLDVTETSREVAFCAHAIQNTDPFVIENASTDTRFKNNPLVTGDPNIQSYLGIPLVSPDGFKVGTLCAIDTVPREFDAQSIELMKHLSQLVVHQLELRQRIDRDPLTGALTRSAFANDVKQAISIFLKQKIPSTLVVLDLENFKTLNDTFGNIIGDELLRCVSESVTETLRLSDSFGRIGGEEFAILMTGISAEQAAKKLDQVRDLIETGTFGRIEALRISPNFGIAQISNDTDAVHKWFRNADTELRITKRRRISISNS
ncbi:MAG: sensor domain-containing diguanylate cyclase [Parasphingorhabdus sp.]